MSSVASSLAQRRASGSLAQRRASGNAMPPNSPESHVSEGNSVFYVPSDAIPAPRMPPPRPPPPLVPVPLGNTNTDHSSASRGESSKASQPQEDFSDVEKFNIINTAGTQFHHCLNLIRSQAPTSNLTLCLFFLLRTFLKNRCWIWTN
jgi:hypothetical protein